MDTCFLFSSFCFIAFYYYIHKIHVGIAHCMVWWINKYVHFLSVARRVDKCENENFIFFDNTYNLNIQKIFSTQSLKILFLSAVLVGYLHFIIRLLFLSK